MNYSQPRRYRRWIDHLGMVGGFVMIGLLIWLGISVLTEDVPKLTTAMADDYQAAQASKNTTLQRLRNERVNLGSGSKTGGSRTPRNAFAAQPAPTAQPTNPDPVLNPDFPPAEFSKEELISTQGDGNDY